MDSPVVRGWMQNKVILHRAAASALCILPREYLSRSDIIINVEVLIPLIRFLGLRPSIYTIRNEVTSFFHCARPPGMRCDPRPKLGPSEIDLDFFEIGQKGPLPQGAESFDSISDAEASTEAAESEKEFLEDPELEVEGDSLSMEPTVGSASGDRRLSGSSLSSEDNPWVKKCPHGSGKEELERQGAILEELQRLLALQAEEEKLTELLAALQDQDGADHQDTLPHDLAESVAVEKSFIEASKPDVVVHDEQRVARELFPPSPTAKELQLCASIAEAPGVSLADEVLPETSNIAEAAEDPVADEAMPESNLAEAPEDPAADEVMPESNIAEAPEVPVADEVMPDSDIAEAPEDPVADEVMPDSDIAEAPEDPEAADKVMADSSLQHDTSRFAEAPEAASRSCTETEPESCDDHTKHYEFDPEPNHEGSKPANPALKRSDRVRPSILKDLAALSPEEQTRLARPTKGEEADDEDEDSAEAHKRIKLVGPNESEPIGLMLRRTSYNEHSTNRPHGGEVRCPAELRAGPLEHLLWAQHATRRRIEALQNKVGRSASAPPGRGSAATRHGAPPSGTEVPAPAVDPKQAPPKVSAAAPPVYPKQAAPKVSTAAPPVDPKEAASKVSAAAPPVDPKQAAPKVSTAAPPLNPKRPAAAAPPVNPKQAAPKVSAAAPPVNPKQAAAPIVSSDTAGPEATRGSSFDSAWRYCATLPDTPLEKPQPDADEKSPPGEHRGDSIPLGYSPGQMADNSFAWAASKGLLRTNEVHKAEEAKLVIEEKFSNRTERGTSRTMTAEAEDEDGYMLEDDVAGAENNPTEHKPSDGVAAKGKPFVLQGEAEEDEQPTGHGVAGLNYRIANHMQSLLDQMNNLYKTLTEQEAEAVTDLDGSIPGL
ncbi:FAM186A [Symbiodinium sp. CCMP2592]|nr:FAM186A [Symbiodinium sp. CCMP2592]